ncbi:RNA methyltransferase [Candidatus Haliotispira prima]|uniref:RNA methyltransferase n=1 Tax=Candidatus Haliotispira prima TaxID=3034016 RepID=A0ABY8MHP2_9SPIO|nr:RNA methyltransferase [Candidatus Haliotispira prima]
MEYYNSFHSITEFLKQDRARQGQSRLLLDRQRLHNAHRDAEKGKKSRMLQLIELAKENNVKMEARPPQELQSLLEQSHYRGYVLALDRLDPDELQAKAADIAEILVRRPDLVIMLDGVLDVGNLGAIVRSSDLFGAGAVFVSHRSAGRSDRNAANQLSRAASGANAWVPVIEGNLARMALQLQEAGYQLYGADMRGKPAAHNEFSRPCVLILGAEERGIHTRMREICDELVRIPTEGHLDSLNVSAAGAVLMYEIRRGWNLQ